MSYSLVKQYHYRYFHNVPRLFHKQACLRVGQGMCNNMNRITINTIEHVDKQSQPLGSHSLPISPYFSFNFIPIDFQVDRSSRMLGYTANFKYCCQTQAYHHAEEHAKIQNIFSHIAHTSNNYPEGIKPVPALELGSGMETGGTVFQSTHIDAHAIFSSGQGRFFHLTSHLLRRTNSKWRSGFTATSPSKAHQSTRLQIG